MKTFLNSLILVLIAALVGVSSTTFAAEGERPAVTPRNDLENWDDDVWADWGVPPSTKSEAETGEMAAEATSFSESATASNSSSDRFGSSPDRIQFRLVREGDEGPKGVRKYRPKY